MVNLYRLKSSVPIAQQNSQEIRARVGICDGDIKLAIAIQISDGNGSPVAARIVNSFVLESSVAIAQHDSHFHAVSKDEVRFAIIFTSAITIESVPKITEDLIGDRKLRPISGMGASARNRATTQMGLIRRGVITFS